MFYWRSTIRGADGRRWAEVAFTGRAAARGQEPYLGLNLGGHVGDDPDVVAENREAVAAALGLPRSRFVFLNQVHGTDVVQVAGPWPGPAPEADGMVTTADELGLGVLVADCVPVLLHDLRAGVIGVVHAGRPGMLGGVVPRAVEQMRSLGAQRLGAVVGPSVCGRCYEVPSELVQRAATVAPSSVTTSWSGTPAIDVASGVVEQLTQLDVTVDRVPGCTREDEDLYSYRREGTTGRFAGVIVMHEDASR
ncbi:peptidoglycan editing factor PgeF [Intrasporangium calvum]|uniref:Purine nucleoside phosphorylase n=1 Tax=Intrasporangium calvum TaxID=53358 RepID=A0ABT5GI51_9MICO|nr:peptidoglycan editing factor PgeF [Intrasporangium calvum]MDC5697867.1 peptidoglycan editing factor PgeF [Intrasporangium calvum]